MPTATKANAVARTLTTCGSRHQYRSRRRLRHLRKNSSKGITNPVTLRYATIIAYVNGTGALLRTFSSNRQQAIAMINNLSPEAFNWHVRKYHPLRRRRHLMKVEAAYDSL